MDPTEPNVTWYTAADGSCRVFMHAGDTVRIFTAPTVAAAEQSIVSVCVDAFGMDQETAKAFASEQVDAQQQIATAPDTMSDHVALLQEQLTEAQAKIEELEAQIVKLTTPSPPTPTDVGVPSSGPSGASPTSPMWPGLEPTPPVSSAPFLGPDAVGSDAPASEPAPSPPWANPEPTPPVTNTGTI
jgi:hypothetical protein